MSSYQDIIDCIDQVDWSKYQTAYGPADDIANQLKKLVLGNEVEVLEATHVLWCSLCHQHAYISSAAFPSYPILMEVLKSTEDKVALEIMDILYGFAFCSAPKLATNTESSWALDLRKAMKQDLPYYEKLSSHLNEGIRDFASRIIDALKTQ